MDTKPCAICGAEMPAGATSNERRRLYCGNPACKVLADMLAAAERAVRAVKFTESEASVAARRKVRARLLALANQVPTEWNRPRDERGHFLRRNRA